MPRLELERVRVRKTDFMTWYAHARIILSALLVLLPLASRAQKFQEPTRDELQMTTDPKAPGAPAVFLDREESTDNFSHFISEYARIKVLTELGKEWATVEVPYSGGGVPPVIEGRTIHPDGTVVPLAGKSADLLMIKSFRNHMRARVFNLPSVEVGSILEYRWTLPISDASVGGVRNDMQEFIDSALAMSIPYWDVQQDLYVHEEKFYFNPLGDLERNVIGNQSIVHFTANGEVASYLIYSARLPADAHVQMSPKKDYTLEIQDVPAYVHEAYAPPEGGTRYNVRFYYTPYLSADVYWNDEGKRWSKEIDRFAEVTDDLKAAAAQITAGAPADEAKARKLYDAVQALENTAFSRERSAAERERLHLPPTVRTAHQVWSEKSGTRNEIALLYLALARSAGLRASAMAVADRSRRIFDPGYLSLDQLTATVVVLHINGTDIFVDPGEKLAPFGQLAWVHTLCGGLTQTADGTSHTQVTPSNNPKDAITAHAADLAVEADGNVSGTVKLLINGPEALRWRQLNLTADMAEVQRQIGEQLRMVMPAGLSAETPTVQGLETSEGFVSATMKVSGHLGSAAGKRLMVPGFFFLMGQRQVFVSNEQRTEPVDLHYAGQVIDDVVYHLPAGYVVESAPQPAQLPWPEHAVLVVKTQLGAGTIDIKHILAWGYVLLEPKEYPALREYYQRIAANDQQQLVLAPGAGAAGN